MARRATSDPEREALRRLLRRGYRYALSLCHDPPRAEDLVQDAWLAVMRRGGPWHAGYLFTTIRHRFIDEERRRDLVLLEPLDEESGEVPDPGAPHGIPEIDRAALRQALGRLRTAEREALFLAAVEGYTVAEVSRLTGRPLGTVSSLIQRARRKVAESLARSDAGGGRSAAPGRTSP